MTLLYVSIAAAVCISVAVLSFRAGVLHGMREAMTWARDTDIDLQDRLQAAILARPQKVVWQLPINVVPNDAIRKDN